MKAELSPTFHGDFTGGKQSEMRAELRRTNRARVDRDFIWFFLLLEIRKQCNEMRRCFSVHGGSPMVVVCPRDRQSFSETRQERAALVSWRLRRCVLLFCPEYRPNERSTVAHGRVAGHYIYFNNSASGRAPLRRHRSDILRRVKRIGHARPWAD